MSVNAADVEVKVTANTADFEAGLARADKASKEFAQNLVRDVGEAIGTAFSVKAVIDAALKIEDAQKSIRAETGATGEALAGLENSFATVYAGVPEASDAVAHALAIIHDRTGLAGAALEGLTKNVIDFNRLTHGDLNSTLTGTTRIFGDWQIATNQQAAALDTLLKVEQQTGTSSNELLDTLTRYSPALRAIGFSFEQAAALIGQFQKDGVTSMRVLMPLTQGIDRLAEAGIQHLGPAFHEIERRIKAATTETQALDIATKVFGARGAVYLVQAIREGKLNVDKLVGSLNASKETVAGAAKDAETFGQAWDKAKHDLELALKPIGDDLIPLMKGTVAVVREVADALKLLPQPARQALEGLAGLLVINQVIGAFRTFIALKAAVTGTLATEAAAADGAAGAFVGLRLAINSVAAGVLIALPLVAKLFAARQDMWNAQDARTQSGLNLTRDMVAAREFDYAKGLGAKDGISATARTIAELNHYLKDASSSSDKWKEATETLSPRLAKMNLTIDQQTQKIVALKKAGEGVGLNAHDSAALDAYLHGKDKGGGGGGGGGHSVAVSEAVQQTKALTDATSGLNREVALSGNTTRAAALAWDMVKGQYALASKASKELAMNAAKAADAAAAHQDFANIVHGLDLQIRTLGVTSKAEVEILKYNAEHVQKLTEKEKEGIRVRWQAIDSKEKAMETDKAWNDSLASTVKIGTDYVANLREQIATIGLTTEAEKALYQMKKTGLLFVAPELARIIIEQAKLLDQKKEEIALVAKSVSPWQSVGIAISDAINKARDFYKAQKENADKAFADSMRDLNLELLKYTKGAREAAIASLMMTEHMTRAQAEALVTMRAVVDKAQQMAELSKQLGDQIANGIMSGLERVGKDGFGGLMAAWRQTLAQMAADYLRSQLANLFTRLLGGLFSHLGGAGGGGGTLPDLGSLGNLGGRAGGGPVYAGTPYVVGERGPELFVPGSSGRIVPNGGGGVTVNMTVVTPDANSFRKSQDQMMQDAHQAATRARRRNG